jgi:hypothetical protein
MNTIEEIKKVYEKAKVDLNKFPHYSDPEEFGKQIAAKNRKSLFHVYSVDGTKDLNQSNA